MNRFRKVSRSLIYAFTFLLVAAPAAFAHAHPKTMTPAPDSTGPAPNKISITFSEAIEPKFSSIKLTDVEGKSVDPEASVPAPGDPTTLTLAVRKLPAGTYVVRWSNVSVDGHQLQGSYKFTVR